MMIICNSIANCLVSVLRFNRKYKYYADRTEKYGKKEEAVRTRPKVLLSRGEKVKFGSTFVVIWDGKSLVEWC